jgi:hypothetical protein
MRYSAMLVAALFSLGLAAQPVGWTATPEGGVLELSGGYNVAPKVMAGGSYSVVEMAGAGSSGLVGQPDLPVYRELVEIPFGAEVSVSATWSGVDTRTLSAPVAPVQASVPKSGPVPAFAFDAKTYALAGPYGEIGARVAEIVEVRGHRLALVEIAPASYMPATGELSVARDLRVELRWTGADWGQTRRMATRYASPAFAGRLQGIARGHERFVTDPPALPVGYLIIVPDAWQANIAPLAAWRKRMGFDVFVRNLSQVGGSSSTIVKNYIQNAYNTWPIPPSFVLLVGDVDRIGYFVGQGTGNPPTDLDFACLAGGDYLPDIDLSRASMASAAQLDSFVARVVGYEQRTLGGGTEWLKKGYFIASADGGYHGVAEATHRYVMGKIRPMGVICDSLWLYYGSGTPITTAINGGRSWVTYSGHGGEDCWADPSPTFDIADVHALTNTDLIPYVQTFACVSGNFASSSYPECFSEAWIRNGRRGALAHIASSVNSYWTEDDTLERRVFDYMFDSTYTWTMGGFNKAKIKFYQQFGASGMTRRYLEMYNLMGDGGSDVYSLEPRSLAVAYPPVIPVGAYALNVGVTASGNPVRGALVCALGKDDTTVFVRGYTDAGGNVVLNLTTLMPDSIYLTVTGHNLQPHLGAVMALPSSGPYVMYQRHTVDDAAGNNDGIINPGESINLPMWLRNWGSSTANGVTARLRTSDANITLTDTLKAFGSIAAGDSAWSGASGFGFAVAPSCTNRYPLRFSVVCRDAVDSTWTSPLTLLVGAPQLDYAGNLAVDPPPGGNGNGMIDPGEQGEIIVTLRNTGLGVAAGVTATLRSGDARLVVLDSLGSFGDIAPETTGTNSGDRFSVSAAGSIPREAQVPCTLVVRTGAIVSSYVFALDIGVIRSMDPIPDGPRTPTLYYAYDATDVLYTEAPVFAWVDIEGVGTRLTLSDDQTQTISLPPAFGPFRYYGQTFSQLSICGNGWVAPGATTSSAYSNAALPDAQSPGVIAPVWDDLYPPSGNGVWYYHDAANGRFVIQWDSMPYYSSRTVYDWFQVIIHDTTMHTTSGDNVVLMQFLTANGYSSSTTGIEDPASTIGINYLFDGGYHRGAAPIVAGMAVKYTTNPPLPNTGLVEGSERLLPVRFALLGNWPNPFDRGTRISYTVPRQMRVSLGVYDPSGRRVAGLVDGTVDPGTHSAYWNGCDARGRRVARGVYFYRLDGEATSAVRKAVLID